MTLDLSVNRSEGTSPSTRRCSPISLVCHSNHVNVVFVYRPANLGSTTSTTSNYDDNPTNPGRLTSTPVDTAAPTRTTRRGPSNRQPVKTVKSHVISVQAFTGVCGCGFYASPAGATLTLWGFSPGAPLTHSFPLGLGFASLSLWSVASTNTSHEGERKHAIPHCHGECSDSQHDHHILIHIHHHPETSL